MSNAPVHQIKVGSIALSVWENEVGKGKDAFTAQSVSIQKNYKDKNGEWKSSGSFKFTELMNIIIACQEALKFKYLKEDVDFLSDE